MKSFLRYFCVLAAMLMVVVGDVWGQTYNGGTWYSLYNAGEFEINTVGSKEYSVFAPTNGTISFNWYYNGVLGSRSHETKIYESNNNGGSYTHKGTVSGRNTNWPSASISVSKNINKIKFARETGNTWTAEYKNIKLPLAKHILLESGVFGASSVTVTDGNLATAEGYTSTNAYKIKLRSFLSSGNIKMTSSNSEFHFGNGVTEISLGVANNYCASANGSGTCTSASVLGQISNYFKDVYFSPSVQYNAKARSTKITITDGVNTAYVYLTAPVIPTFYFKAEAIAEPTNAGVATATFANGQSTYSLVAPNVGTNSMSADVTFAASAGANSVFEGWKKVAEDTYYKQGAGTERFTETITSSVLDPRGMASQKTYRAIFSERYTAKITGSNYVNKLVGESFVADYDFVNTQTATPSASDEYPFYFVIKHDLSGNATTIGSSHPTEVISYDPETNRITTLNEGSATITFYQKNTDSHKPVEESFTVSVIKNTPEFNWNLENTPYYYGTSIPNIFSTTNPDVAPVFTSNNEDFARVENNTLYIANARETATITVSQKENYKWNGKTEQYPISPLNGNNHVPFKIDSEAKFSTIFKYHTESGCKWSDNRVMFDQGSFDWDDNYYDIHFEGIPDKLTFKYDADGSATGKEWYVMESINGTDWSTKTWTSTSNSGSASVTLQSSTRYLRLCYSGNLNGYISNIEVTERYQFEATPGALDFGTNGINHGKQDETVTFLHANAGRITEAVIEGADASYFTVSPAIIAGTGRDLYGTARLQVSFDNRGVNRGATPYNAVLVIRDNANHRIEIPLTGVRNGKSTPEFIWNPNALPYYFNTTIANIAFSTNKDANCPLTFVSSDETIAKVIDGDLYIYGKGQEVTITVSQADNADYVARSEKFTFTPCARPNLEVPFQTYRPLHKMSVQFGTKCKWLDDIEIEIGDAIWGGFEWGDERKRVLVTFAGVPDKLSFDHKFNSASDITPATPENAQYAWYVEESPNGVDWTYVWSTSSLSEDWKSSGEIPLNTNTQYVRIEYKGNFAGYIKNINISALDGYNYLRAEEGTYLSRGAKYGTQAVVDPFGVVCRVSRFTTDNINQYSRFQFVDNMQYLWETHDTKELFTDDKTAANSDNLWQKVSNASGKFTIQSGNALGNQGQYVTIDNDVLTFTTDVDQATIWHMETPSEHDLVIKNYMDAAAAWAAQKDFGTEVNTLEKVRSNIDIQDFEVTEIEVPMVTLSQQIGEYRDGINGTFAVYDDTIEGLEPGFYRLTVKALYRTAESQYAQEARKNNWESVVAYIYANQVKYPIQSVYDSYNASSYDPSSDELLDGHYYPAKLQPSVEQAFNEINRYLNDVYVYIEADPGKTTGTLRYGIKNPSYVPGAWLAYSTITLTRFARKEYIFECDDSQAPGDWNTSNNWNRDAVPNQYHIVTIKSNANISMPVAVFSMNVVEDKKVNITSSGGLTIGGGGVVGVEDNTITIDNTPKGAGFLRVNPYATHKPEKVIVNYQTKTYNNGSAGNEVWQYIGMPGTDGKIDDLTGVTMYHWDETKGWIYQTENDVKSISAWEGFAFTQSKEQEATFQINVTPIFDVEKEIDLTCTTTGSGMHGDNLFVNSYLAPIDVTQIDENDIIDPEGNLTRTFFIFNSGSWNNWNNGKGDITANDYDKSSPGHYYSIPIHSAKFINDGVTQVVIPSMQGVYVYSSGEATIKLNYQKHVMAASATKDAPGNLNTPLRAPQSEVESAFQRVRIQATSQNSGADRLYIIQEPTTTKGYDNGYDGDNIMANGQVNIYTNEPFGQMEVSCSNNMDSMWIGFAAGEDTVYTLHFGALVGEDIYIKDISNDSVMQLTDGGQYTFYAQPNSQNDMRFQLLLNLDLPTDEPEQEEGGVTTNIEDATTTQLWMNAKHLYIAHAQPNSQLEIYNASGMLMTAPHTLHATPCTINLSHLPTGVYVLRINNKAYKFVCE